MDAPPEQQPDANTPTEVARLRAERDELAGQVESMRHRRGGAARTKSIFAGILVGVFALSFLASGLGIWLKRNTLNTDVWEQRVAPLGADPEIQEALAIWATDQLMTTVDPKGLFQEALPERAQILAVPLTTAVEGFVFDRVEAFFATDRFEELWATASVRAHEAVVATLRDERPNVDAGEESITINLVPLMNDVLAGILDSAPGLVGSDVDLPDLTVEDIPEEARDRLSQALGRDLSEDFGTITIYDGGKLNAAQEAVKTLDKAVVLFVVLTIGSFIGALVLSRRKRRTFLQLLGAAAVGSVLVRRGSFALEEQVEQLVTIGPNRDAASVVVQSFVQPVTNAAAVLLWIIAIAALITILTGPYRRVVAFRHWVAATATSIGASASQKAGDERTQQWVEANIDALRVGGIVVTLGLMWFLDMSWLLLFLLLCALAGWMLLLARIAPLPPQDVGNGRGPAAPA